MKTRGYTFRSTGLMLIIAAVAVGCDFNPNMDRENVQEPLFLITDDAMQRTTLFGGAEKTVAAGELSSVSATDYLSLSALVTPPTINGTLARASHLDFDGNRIYAGYKIWKKNGYQYGGGIDILRSGNGNSVAEARTYSSENFDVQEVVYDSSEDAIYVAGAMERKEMDDPKSWLLKLDSKTARVLQSVGLSGNVAKSVDITNANNGKYVYTVTDTNNLYRFNKNLGSKTVLTASNGVVFRSVGARFQNQVFTLDVDGNVYRTNPSFNGFQFTQNMTGGNSLRSDLAISRLGYFNKSNPNVVLVALNEYGFGILNPAGQTDWYSRNSHNPEIASRYYTSVTGYTNGRSGNQRDVKIYAAGITPDGRQVIDIFDLPNGWQGHGADFVATLDLSGFNELSDGQLNHIIATDKYLYAAKGSDGVVIFKIK